MVDALSKILEFSNEDRLTLGLKPTDNKGGPNISQLASTVTIADKLVSYFLHDD